MEACLKADQRNGPCIMLTVVFKFNYCLLLLLSRWVLIFLEKPHIGSLLGLFFHQNWVLIRSLFLAQWVLLINWLHCDFSMFIFWCRILLFKHLCILSFRKSALSFLHLLITKIIEISWPKKL